MIYTLLLARQQVAYLLETVQAFVDNKKWIHLPDREGRVIALPLTEEALKRMLGLFDQQGWEGKQEVVVTMEKRDGDLAQVRIELGNSSWEYTANLNEFDLQ
jgi:hypothetical protein